LSRTDLKFHSELIEEFRGVGNSILESKTQIK
jgi:hypothetical protein